MAATKLVFPDKSPLWKMRSKLEIADINYGGHMGNEVILKKAQEARMQLLHSWGWTERNAGGTGIIQTEAWVGYKSEGFWGEELVAEIFSGEVHSRGFDLLYHFWILGEPRRELAQARISMLCFDYERRKVHSISEDLKYRLLGG